MRKSLALKSLLRSPLKTLLTFLLIAAASLALFSRVADHAVTLRETESAKSLYHAVASLDNGENYIPVTTASVDSPDRMVGRSYGTQYKQEGNPWLTEQELAEFISLPGVTLADTRYTTAGQVEDYKRMVGEGDYGGFVVFEGDYEGYEEDESTLEGHVRLKFDHVNVLACDGGPEVEKSFTTEDVPLGEMDYAKSPYTRAFYDSLEKGTRCFVLARNSGYSANGSSGIMFEPYSTEEASLCVIDGLPDDYLETEAFVCQKGWVDAVNYNNYVYDIVYTSDMRAIPSFNKQRLVVSKGRSLTAEDEESCVVSADFLDEHGLSIGDTIRVRLGDKFGCTTTVTNEDDLQCVALDARKISGRWESVELSIVGAYGSGRGNAVYAPSPNTVYVPSGLLPVEVPDDYEPAFGEFSVFVEDADDIEAFHEAAEQFAGKVGLTLSYSDRGWLDVKDSMRLGNLTSTLTTILYVAGAALALFLAVYLYIGRYKKTYAILRMLGVPGRTAEASVLLPFAVVAATALAVGGMAGLYYAQGKAEAALLGMAQSAPEGYVPDASLSVDVIILCLVVELLFVSLAAYFFLRKMKKVPPLELLQENGKMGQKAGRASVSPDPGVLEESHAGGFDLSKLSSEGGWTAGRKYGSVRHVCAYVWRHMRRGRGKSAISLLLTVVLAAGIGSFVMARLTYRDAFHELGVKGEAFGFTYTSAVALSKSPLVKNFYCTDSFNVHVKDTEINIPMTVTSDLMRNMGGDCPVDYAEGYDISAFEGTGQVCLVGKEIADKLDISLGDEIGIMSDFLYFVLKKGGNEESVSAGYKMYKVIGIAESEDADIRGTIFTGIRSDLQRIFSIDFSIDHCEFTLADNEKLDKLDAVLEEMRIDSLMYSPDPSYNIDTGGLSNIERIRSLLEALFPIAVAAAVLIGLFGPLLVILQSAQEAAFLRILGVTKKCARCMLVFEQIILCIAGILLVAGGLTLYDPGRFAGGIDTFLACFGLYFLGCICGACAAAVQVTRGRLLELLQGKE